MKYSNSLTLHVLFLFLVVFQSGLCANFYEAPSHMFDSGLKDGVTLQLSPDNKYFIIGFSSGLLKVYQTSTGSLSYTLQNHRSSILLIFWEGQDLITVDSSGLVLKWNQQFGVSTRWNVPGQFTNCGKVKIGQILYISFNNQTTIQEYKFEGRNITKGDTYTASPGNLFNFSIYDSTHSYLYAALISGQTEVYYTLNQTLKTTFNTNWAMLSMEIVSYSPAVNYIIGTDLSSIYQINQNGILKTADFYYSTIAKNCRKQQFFVAISSGNWWFQTLNKQTLNKIQDLGYPKSGLNAAACSDQYLVTIGADGWITINQYQQSKSLTIIIMVVVFVLILAAIFIANKKYVNKQKKKKEQQKTANYNRIKESNQINIQ